MMVDDLQNLRFLKAGHGLRRLVVIHQHDALAPRAQQVPARQHADDLLVLIENRIAVLAVLEQLLAHIVHAILQVEGRQVLRLADSSHRCGLEDAP